MASGSEVGDPGSQIATRLRSISPSSGMSMGVEGLQKTGVEVECCGCFDGHFQGFKGLGFVKPRDPGILGLGSFQPSLSRADFGWLRP